MIEIIDVEHQESPEEKAYKEGYERGWNDSDNAWLELTGQAKAFDWISFTNNPPVYDEDTDCLCAYKGGHVCIRRWMPDYTEFLGGNPDWWMPMPKAPETD